MKKNWKQFWTLNRHHAEGFTLVELIVVIAILAILSAVAVPAYSGYINKTHMTTDQKLVSEVADALTLFYYANPGAGSAFVVLTPDGAYADNDPASISNGEKAMEAVFGSGWANTALSYGKWDEEATSMLGAAGTSGAAVMGSSYMNANTGDLLATVGSVTQAAAGVFGSATNDGLYSTLDGLLGEGTLAGLVADYDIDVVTENGVTNFGSSVDQTTVANLMVMAAAKEAANGTESTISGVVNEYAKLAGAVYASNDPALIAEFNEMNKFEGATGLTDVRNQLGGFVEGNIDQLGPYLENEALVESDQAAFQALMGTLNNASGEITAEDLASGNFTTSGKLGNHFNAYVSAAEALAELGSVPANSIAVFLNTDSGVPMIYCSNSAAYLQGK